MIALKRLISDLKRADNLRGVEHERNEIDSILTVEALSQGVKCVGKDG